MPTNITLDVISYIVFIDGMRREVMLFDIERILNVMNRNGVTLDNITYNMLLHGYCKGGNVEQANPLVGEMSRKKYFTNMDYVQHFGPFFHV